jgi:hypothetical protein
MKKNIKVFPSTLLTDVENKNSSANFSGKSFNETSV